MSAHDEDEVYSEINEPVEPAAEDTGVVEDQVRAPAADARSNPSTCLPFSLHPGSCK